LPAGIATVFGIKAAPKTTPERGMPQETLMDMRRDEPHP
jgi:hypothetical protein